MSAHGAFIHREAVHERSARVLIARSHAVRAYCMSTAVESRLDENTAAHGAILHTPFLGGVQKKRLKKLFDLLIHYFDSGLILNRGCL